MNERVATLLSHARQDLAASRENLKLGYVEVATSRSYYCMFYIAEAFLASKGKSFSSHAGVIAGFGQIFARPGQVPPEYHRFLIAAQRLRLDADYALSSLSIPEVEEQIQRAEKFLHFAEEFFGFSEP